jgi:hypothetical protein
MDIFTMKGEKREGMRERYVNGEGKKRETQRGFEWVERDKKIPIQMYQDWAEKCCSIEEGFKATWQSSGNKIAGVLVVRSAQSQKEKLSDLQTNLGQNQTFNFTPWKEVKLSTKR